MRSDAIKHYTNHQERAICHTIGIVSLITVSLMWIEYLFLSPRATAGSNGFMLEFALTYYVSLLASIVWACVSLVMPLKWVWRLVYCVPPIVYVIYVMWPGR